MKNPLEEHRAKRFIERLREYEVDPDMMGDEYVEEGRTLDRLVMGTLIGLGAIAVPVIIYTGFKLLEEQ